LVSEEQVTKEFPMTTANNIITLALKDCGVVGEGETPSSETINDALTTLVGMLDLWQVDGLIPFAEVLQNLTVNGAASYNLTIPYGVQFIVYTPDGSAKYPLRDITLEEFSSLSFPLTTGIPTRYTYSVGATSGTLKLYPNPSSGTIQYGVTTDLTTALGLTVDVPVPKAYVQAIRFNLAVLLATTFGVAARPDIAAIASASLGILKRANLKQKRLANTIPTSSTIYSFNIFQGA